MLRSGTRLRRFVRARIFILSLIAVFFGALPARADLAAFNDAIRAGDYPLAARAAVSAWPTLGKTRDDIGVIAREFAFAAMVAKDYENAVVFATTARERPPEGDEHDLHVILANIMLHASVLPGDAPRRVRNEARDQLRAALRERVPHGGFDLISLVSGALLINYHMERSDWDEASEDAGLLADLAENGGPTFKANALDLRLTSVSARAIRKPNEQDAQAIHDFTKDILAEMEAAQTDEQALALLPQYWQALAWFGAVESYVLSGGGASTIGSRINRRARDTDPICDCDPEELRLPDRVSTPLGWAEDGEGCEKTRNRISPPIRFPSAARLRGVVGSVLIAVDLDEDGQAYNGRVLAGVPEKHFAEAALKRVPSLSYRPGEEWDPEVCTLAQKHRLIKFVFVIS